MIYGFVFIAQLCGANAKTLVTEWQINDKRWILERETRMHMFQLQDSIAIRIEKLSSYTGIDEQIYVKNFRSSRTKSGREK